MEEVFNYIRKQFEQPRNTIMQLIILQTLAFITLQVVKIICLPMGSDYYTEHVLPYVALSHQAHHLWHRPWTLVTYVFVNDLGSFVLAVLALHNLGRVIHMLLGSTRVAQVYLSGTVAGGMAFLLFYSQASYLKDAPPPPPLVGASVATYALMAAAATVTPRLIHTLFVVVPIQLRYLLLFSICWSLQRISEGNSITGIAQLVAAAWGHGYIRYLSKPSSAWHAEGARFLGRLKRRFFFWRHGLHPHVEQEREQEPTPVSKEKPHKEEA